MTSIPDGYRWPGGDVVGDSTGSLYWLHEDDDGAATRRYTVIGAVPGEQHIVAERCYLHWAIKIVDALRRLDGEAT